MRSASSLGSFWSEVRQRRAPRAKRACALLPPPQRVVRGFHHVWLPVLESLSSRVLPGMARSPPSPSSW